ncbi:MAG: alpha/beta hydrolase [Oscillospiraceae bacterium]|jgi:pimeloyl-ACP methyl ester carboxylesterase|nr:alpha/beta hydrolase [Oscillospiraceae bacterium]
MKTRKDAYTIEKPIIGGAAQAILTPQDDPKKPLALVVHGGPGEPMTPYLDALKPIADRFVMCLWEQRGAGMSYAADIPKESMHISQYVDDAIAVARRLLKQYGREKLWLFGFSWGTLISVLAAQKAPELFAAYVGVGQIASQLASEQAAYDWVMDKARAKGDKAGIRLLEEAGRPPYPKENTMAHVLKGRKVFFKYNESPGKRPTMGKVLWGIFTCPFYTLRDKFHYIKGAQGGGAVFLEILDVDLNKLAPALAIPVVIVQGKYDLQTMPQMAEAYVQALEAPSKAFYLFEQSGHGANDDEPERFARVLDEALAARTP